jgi:hypothetical protein
MIVDWGLRIRLTIDDLSAIEDGLDNRQSILNRQSIHNRQSDSRQSMWQSGNPQFGNCR